MSSIEIDNCAINKLKLKKSNSILVKETNIDRIKEKKCMDIIYK